MINEQELQISNKSYTNKDFAVIYPELLELVKKLTNKWDPTTSNESDPGVILLKLLAFIGDKNNYNIDKNMGEVYMPSATQESSMRKLCEMNGYNMKYYNSATIDLSFMYKGNIFTTYPGDYFELKAFETVITDVDKTVSYTLINNLTINTKNQASQISAIQGTVKNLTIGDTNLIQLTNLNDNNILYLPEAMVAENGIFISNQESPTNFWDKIDNLNLSIPGNKVYKFGFDSDLNLPYIEFPSDIATLIESGIYVKYTITDGLNGNVKAGILTQLLSPSTITLSNSGAEVDLGDNQANLTIINLNSSINGANPETIDEAYNGFKKTIGTFETLVTCRDYANAIYNSLTSDSSPIVSNIQVTDRRGDFNYSNIVVTWDQYGISKISNENSSSITPFDLCLYPLKPILNSYTDVSYNDSFQPLTDLTDINLAIGDLKTISHNFKTLATNDIYCFKNYYNLNAKITTNAKVTTFEQTSILSNIWLALYQAFNAREIDYGYEIPYDMILETIQNADTRIKNVSLAEPTLTTKILVKTGDNSFEEKVLDDVITGNETYYVDLLAKNILAGKISLFDYDTNFNYKFGQSISSNATTTNHYQTSGSAIYNNINKISTAINISTSNYTLKDNETIQAVAPNLVNEITYQYGTNYRFESEIHISEATKIEANTEYELKTNETLKINYTDSNGTIHNDPYTTGAIIKATFDLINTDNVDGTGTHPVTGDGKYFSLSTNDELSKRKIVSSTISTPNLPCYWIMNNTNNTLFTSSNYNEVILGENEYFMYSNNALTDLVILGSGTRLSLDHQPASNWSITSSIITAESISNQGLAAFSAYNWQRKDFNTNPLTITEMQILVLNKGAVISWENWDLIDGTHPINNSFTPLLKSNVTSSPSLTVTFNDHTFYSKIPTLAAGNYRFTYNGTNWQLNNTNVVLSEYGITYTGTAASGNFINIEEVDATFNYDSSTLSTLNISGVNWKIKSRLDLNCGPNSPQLIQSGQTINLYYNNASYTITTDSDSSKATYIQFNNLIQQTGQTDLTLNDSTIAYVYNYAEIDNVALEINGDGTMIVNCKDYTSAITLPLININHTSTSSNATQLLLIYWNHLDNNITTNVSVTASTAALRKYNSGANLTSALTLSNGINIVEIDPSLAITNIGLTITTSSSARDTIYIGNLDIIQSLNPALNLDETNDANAIAALKAKISTLATKDSKDLFYYNNPIENAAIIDVSDLKSSSALWDYNNLANKCTIAELDITNSTIEIVKTSRI